jgi:hypothetical protein
LFIIPLSTSLLFFIAFIETALALVVADRSLSAFVPESLFASVVAVWPLPSVTTARAGNDLDHVVVAWPPVSYGCGDNLGSLYSVTLWTLGHNDDRFLDLGQRQAMIPGFEETVDDLKIVWDVELDILAPLSVNDGKWSSSFGVHVSGNVSGITPASVTKISVLFPRGVWIGTGFAFGSVPGEVIHNRVLVVA